MLDAGNSGRPAKTETQAVWQGKLSFLQSREIPSILGGHEVWATRSQITEMLESHPKP